MDISGEALLVILVAGWVAGQVVWGTGFGPVGDLIAGSAGAFIASWILPRSGIDFGSGIVSAIIIATMGAVLLLMLISLVPIAFRSSRSVSAAPLRELRKAMGTSKLNDLSAASRSEVPEKEPCCLWCRDFTSAVLVRRRRRDRK